MIPLKDDVKSQSTPFVNYTIIGLNIVVFIYELMLGPQLQDFIMNYGMVPQRFFYFLENPSGNLFMLVFPFFSSVFMHGGFFHIIFNMLFLFIFGDNVEDSMGHLRYLIFYLLCGIGATFIHILFNTSSPIPSIGASGAIAGVMGAYLILHPKAKVLTLIPLGFFIRIVYIPAIFFLVLWFILQLFSGVASIGVSAYQNAGGVAWWAHIGGFVCGLLLIFIFRKRKKRLRKTPASLI